MWVNSSSASWRVLIDQGEMQNIVYVLQEGSARNLRRIPHPPE